MTEDEYWRDFQILDVEVQDAITIFHTHEELNRLATSDEAVLSALNEDPLFWKVYSYSLQTSLFIVLGRIFDTSPNAHSIHRLLNTTLAHVDFFSKESLLRRKQRPSGDVRPPWLDSFIEGCWFPSASADLRHLKRELATRDSAFRRTYQPIRSKIYAHRLAIADSAVTALFAGTNVKELGRLLDFLHDLMRVLFDLFQSGREPVLGSRQDYLDRHNRKIRDVINRAMSKVASLERHASSRVPGLEE